MLKPAKLYEEELNRIYQNNLLEGYLKWYSVSYEDTELTIESSFWKSIQLVSVVNEQVTGYFRVRITRPENFAEGLSCINFLPERKMSFALHLRKFFEYLLITKNFPKVGWSVVAGHPLEKAYDKMAEKYGARIVGIMKYETLIDGVYYDHKHYEYINDYYECTHCGHKVKKEEEVSCWRCGLGEMRYINPFRK